MSNVCSYRFWSKPLSSTKMHANSIFVWICWKECNSVRVIRTRLDREKRVHASNNKCTIVCWEKSLYNLIQSVLFFLFHLAKISSQQSSKFFSSLFTSSNGIISFSKKNPLTFSHVFLYVDFGRAIRMLKKRISKAQKCTVRVYRKEHTSGNKNTLQEIKIDLQFKLCHFASLIVVSCWRSKNHLNCEF